VVLRNHPAAPVHSLLVTRPPQSIDAQPVSTPEPCRKTPSGDRPRSGCCPRIYAPEWMKPAFYEGFPLDKFHMYLFLNINLKIQ
jgi:hypothetical protein